MRVTIVSYFRIPPANNDLKLKSPLALASTFILCATLVEAQEPIPRFFKQAIMESGMSVYAPTDSFHFDHSFSDDSADVYTAEVQLDSFTFGVIAVAFTEPYTDATIEDKEELVEGYLDFLQADVFLVKVSAGYGEGHRLESDPSAAGVLDYWTDIEGNDIVVEGWCNENYLAVLYVMGPSEYPYFTAQQMFLGGIRFSTR